MSGIADFNVEDFETREAADKLVFVKFYMKPVLQEDESVKEGRPIYKDVEYIEIRTPGNDTNVPRRPVRDMERTRFRRAYQMFKAGETEQVVGTPLIETPWITRSQVEELAHVHIRTLEQLANVNDDVCLKMPGLFKLKQRAQAALERAEKTAPFIAMQKENEDLRNKLAALELAVADQGTVIKRLEKKG